MVYEQLQQATTSLWYLEMAITITVHCFLIGNCDIITETVIVDGYLTHPYKKDNTAIADSKWCT